MNLNRRSKVSAEFNMSSMTDIVFLLLIFFMIASTLVTTSALDLVLPKSKAQSVKRNVVVNISADKKISVGNKIVSPSELQNEILSQIQNMDEAVLLLRADGAVPYEMVVDVLDIAYRNKLKIIAATDPS
jgi:biopolymer transport protein ExbD